MRLAGLGEVEGNAQRRLPVRGTAFLSDCYQSKFLT